MPAVPDPSGQNFYPTQKILHTGNVIDGGASRVPGGLRKGASASRLRPASAKTPGEPDAVDQNPVGRPRRGQLDLRRDAQGNTVNGAQRN